MQRFSGRLHQSRLKQVKQGIQTEFLGPYIQFRTNMSNIDTLISTLRCEHKAKTHSPHRKYIVRIQVVDEEHGRDIRHSIKVHHTCALL